MIALAGALEAERELRRSCAAHIATSAAPKANELAFGLEGELRKLEEHLVGMRVTLVRTPVIFGTNRVTVSFISIKPHEHTLYSIRAH
jgi:hypothetical protein